MGRDLRPDELELWNRVAKQTTPMQQESRGVDFKAALEESQNAPPPRKKPSDKRVFTEAVYRPTGRQSAPRVRVDLAPTVRAQVQNAPLQMDKKSFTQMKRGKLKPEGRLDLHGLTLDRAHPMLTRFILSAQSNGKRLVLVITGKGKSRDDGGPIPVRYGVLRHQVPHWLSLPPLSSAVLQVSQAHLRHGGGGAYYVYLRKPR